MKTRDRYHDHIDPEYRRWIQKYPAFPGVGECVRLILSRKATGAWADIIVSELAEHAAEHLGEIIDAFRSHESDQVAFHMLMALEIAALPASVGFLADILREGNPAFLPYAQRTLAAIGTKESRRALYDLSDAEQSHAPKPTAGPSSERGSSPPGQ